MQQALNCPNCSSPVTAGQQFCGVCGTTLGGVFQQSAATCPGCGSPINLEQQYCGVCGTQLAGDNQQAKVSQASSPVTTGVKPTPALSGRTLAAKIKEEPGDVKRRRGYGILRFAALIFQVVGWVILVGGSLVSIAMIVFTILGGGFQPIIPGFSNIVGGAAVGMGIACLVISFVVGLAFLAFAELYYMVIEITSYTRS